MPEQPTAFPAQHQNRQPGAEKEMTPPPVYDNPQYKPAGKLAGKTALITGGDSGIGRAVAVAYAKEGADVAIVHLCENRDAQDTAEAITALGRECLVIQADLRGEKAAAETVAQTVLRFGRLDILVNNAAVQIKQNSLADITEEQLKTTFETDVYAYVYLAKAALPHLKRNACVINTSSVTAFRGSKTLIDYSAAKGAVIAFSRSLALSLADSGVRVNAVAPGPVWTPLIVSSFSEEEVQEFGTDTPMKRAAQPYEMAPLYVYLACEDSSNVSGQVFHINSGEIIN